MTSHDPEAGQVPENLSGLTDPDELRAYERRAAYLRVNELEHHPALVVGDFDFPHLQAIHGYILQDVYPWAGRPRRPGQETAAMGMMHCRAEFLDTEIRRVFGAIDRHRPSSTDRDAAIATVADHWGELTALHPFADGNSRSQRLFFHRYLNASGWEIDWRRIDAAAVHAARHVAMATVDSSYLAAVIEPGITHPGHGGAGSLTATQGDRDTSRSVELFDAMMAHQRGGGTGRAFLAEYTDDAATQNAAAGPFTSDPTATHPSSPVAAPSSRPKRSPSSSDTRRGRHI